MYHNPSSVSIPQATFFSNPKQSTSPPFPGCYTRYMASARRKPDAMFKCEMAETRKAEKWVPIQGSVPRQSLYSLNCNMDTNSSRDLSKGPLIRPPDVCCWCVIKTLLMDAVSTRDYLQHSQAGCCQCHTRTCKRMPFMWF